MQPDRGSSELSAIVLDQADRLFRGEVTKQRLAAADRGEWPAQIWDAVNGAGLPLALVPEALGGTELCVSDALRLIRLSGYYAAPVPLAEMMIAASLYAEAFGAAIAGTLTLGPTAPGDAIRIEAKATSYALHGRIRRVPWAGQADHVLLHCTDGAGAGWLALAPAKTVLSDERRNLACEPRGTLAFDGMNLPAAAVRRAPDDCADGFLPFGAVARALQMVGAMERCLDYALTYAMERKQFGRPIGKFQAVQIMLAEAAGQFAAAAAATDVAVEAYRTDNFALTAAIAKARAGEAAGKVAEVCHQTHGAMGFTQEHPLHFSTRRLWSWRDEFGSETFWQERIGRLVCSRGGEALWPLLVGD